MKYTLVYRVKYTFIIMFLTLYDLDNIKSSCDNLSRLVTEIRKSYTSDTQERKLFVSRNDYEESLKIKNQSPEDFYFFRCFDCFIQIVYNRNLKKYLIYSENYYNEILNKYPRYQRSDKSYIISSDFEETFILFKQLIQCCLSDRTENLQNELF